MATAAAVRSLAGVAVCNTTTAVSARSSGSTSATPAASTSLRASGFRGLPLGPVRSRAPVVCTAVIEEAEVEVEKEEAPSPALEALIPSHDEIQNLLMELCDETQIAELKLKVGNFKLHVTRNVGAIPGAAAPAVAAVSAPPVPSQPMVETIAASSAPARPAKVEEEANQPDEGMAYILAPRVGVLRRGRFVKGKKARPVVSEGDIVKEGQVIAYVEQLGTQQPVTATIGGEVNQFLVEDGDPVGFGEPIMEVLPSFHGIKKLF